MYINRQVNLTVDIYIYVYIYTYSGYSGVLQLVYNGIHDYIIVVLSGTQTQRHGTSPI